MNKKTIIRIISHAKGFFLCLLAGCSLPANAPPNDIIIRRFYEGINNLFRIYMPIVDSWILVDNSITPRCVIATGGKEQSMEIRNSVTFKKIEAYVK